jgi:hypothetical protein
MSITAAKVAPWEQVVKMNEYQEAPPPTWSVPCPRHKRIALFEQPCPTNDTRDRLLEVRCSIMNMQML